MEQQPVTDNDEISLIELFIVLLKHRWLIFLPVLTVLLLFVVIYIFYPHYKISRTENEKYYEEALIITISPDLARLREESAMLELLDGFFRDPSVIYKTLLAIDYDAKENLEIELYTDRDKAIDQIKKRLIENKSFTGRKLDKAQRLYTIQKSGSQISLKFVDENPKTARLFLSEISKSAAEKIKEYLQAPAKDYLHIYKDLLILLDSSSMDKALESSLMDIYYKYVVADSVVNNAIEPFDVTESPENILMRDETIPEIRKSIAKKGIILIFAIFFLSVLAAFILNAIENIKKDPATMEKIREALGKNKA
ncbi:hypothetical protein MASR2M29_04180 [Spirochaetota bacterium]